MEKGKVLKYISSACFAILAIDDLIVAISYPANLSIWLFFVAEAMIAVAILASERKLSAVGAGIMAIYEIYLLIASLPWSVTLSFVSLLLLVGFWVLLLIASLSEKSAKTMGFSAAAVYFVRAILILIRNAVYGYRTGFSFVLSAIACIAGAYLIGIVYSSIQPSKKTTDAPASTDTRVSNNTSNNTSDHVDVLTRLKSLLDSGIITQEEFEEKKKQILGL